MPIRLAVLTEGHGEDEAVKRLIHGVLAVPPQQFTVVPVRRGGNHAFRNEPAFVTSLELGIREAGGDPRRVLVLIDAEDKRVALPCQISADLVHWSAERICPAQVYIAQTRYENWIAAGTRGLRADLASCDSLNGETLLRAHFGVYHKIPDQTKLTTRIGADLAAARSASFRRLRTRLSKYLATLA